MSVTKYILEEVADERAKQDREWGPEHDRDHSQDDWYRLLNDYVVQFRLRRTRGSAKRELIKVAALAVAAAECLDHEAGMRELKP